MIKKILVLTCLLILGCKNEKPKNVKLRGSVFGTTYSIIYDAKTNYTSQLDSLFSVINNSLSNYQDNSIISKINREELVETDEHFDKVFKTSKEIFYNTEGAFDPTIGAVVNAWSFGSEHKIISVDSLIIDSLMRSVGFDKIFKINKKITKPKDAFLDFNAIAKGYGVDVVGEFLESKNILNYLVEIGGEVRVKGKNVEKNASWRVGVENPNFNGEQSILKAIELHNEVMATSGTYRKFKIDDNGSRYAHIINTDTGYPTKTNVLSVSVIADRCMVADAYATAFQAMGVNKIKEFLKHHPELKVFLIFENENNEIETLALNGFPE
ncbi:FAD:protein FMN transferase [Neotamlana laminarinivorans]|uniref:FAD:protein FMN transferase n=1 Tax=Neotamlana laminarinivorans TaxID=2883124 RepID=A0A9X1I1Q3_9FLAO|nr:FAD:protein FMN transferase [Tamlana laminarinivorans]MCB4799626.1 FAD:protein FMN transferase [Tamlana laminarinivorans]